MAKRSVEGHDITEFSTKRRRVVKIDRLSTLSDELLVRILSFVPAHTLISCQSVSRKFRDIACDSQLWKAAYYNAFVLPRVRRLPRLRDSSNPSNHLVFSSKSPKWLGDEPLLRRENMNWKAQYKLRHNWLHGKCVKKEIQIPEKASILPLMVRLSIGGVIFAVNSSAELKAWSLKGAPKLLATADISSKISPEAAPTSMAVDGCQQQSDPQRVVIGYEDGRFDVYEFRKGSSRFRKLYAHPSSSNGMLIAIACFSPYLITKTDSGLLSLYILPANSGGDAKKSAMEPPRFLRSYKSHSVSSPLALSIRYSGNRHIVSVAYARLTAQGCTVTIQELHFSSDGVERASRHYTAPDSEYTPMLPEAENISGPGLTPMLSVPTALSYTHPYLLAAHPDNTLTLFVVKSTSTALTISPPRRLDGHSSSVSGAYISGRGKAVSVSTRGGELRVWELEGGLRSSGRNGYTLGEHSVRVRPEERGISSDQDHLTGAISQEGSGLGHALEHQLDDTSITPGWIGFDEENVVLLEQNAHGAQALIVFDFT